MHIQRQSLLNKATKCILYSTLLNEIMNIHRQEKSDYTCAKCIWWTKFSFNIRNLLPNYFKLVKADLSLVCLLKIVMPYMYINNDSDQYNNGIKGVNFVCSTEKNQTHKMSTPGLLTIQGSQSLRGDPDLSLYNYSRS